MSINDLIISLPCDYAMNYEYHRSEAVFRASNYRQLNLSYFTAMLLIKGLAIFILYPGLQDKD